ncbi:Uncharacterized protein Adt_15548 [Abeliophyllum distichum]|uniref:Uncharacterized protein n=1 Tax=Abeliophyllum distichum TaxID=126358 RepID=A0ABD1U2S6_9LAMI
MSNEFIPDQKVVVIKPDRNHGPDPNAHLTQTNGNTGDTTLRLDCFGYGGPDTATFGSSLTKDGGQSIYANASDDGCRLVLGLGPTPSTYSDDYCTDRGLSGNTDEFLNILEFSVATQSASDALHHWDRMFSYGHRLLQCKLSRTM